MEEKATPKPSVVVHADVAHLIRQRWYEQWKCLFKCGETAPEPINEQMLTDDMAACPICFYVDERQEKLRGWQILCDRIVFRQDRKAWRQLTKEVEEWLK